MQVSYPKTQSVIQPEKPTGQPIKYWILKHRKPVPCPSIAKYARWRRPSHRVCVRRSYFDTALISTVFLCYDHNQSSNRKTALFETMIFGDVNIDYCTRCSTWREALAMHKTAIEYFTVL